MDERRGRESRVLAQKRSTAATCDSVAVIKRGRRRRGIRARRGVNVSFRGGTGIEGGREGRGAHGGGDIRAVGARLELRRQHFLYDISSNSEVGSLSDLWNAN